MTASGYAICFVDSGGHLHSRSFFRFKIFPSMTRVDYYSSATYHKQGQGGLAAIFMFPPASP